MIELCELREEDGAICGTPFVCSPSQEAESLLFRIYHEDYEPLCDKHEQRHRMRALLEIELGLQPGPWVGEIVEVALRAQQSLSVKGWEASKVFVEEFVAKRFPDKFPARLSELSFE
jgi:hypothetical protein